MARRVNTKFLIILTLVVGGGGVAALFAERVLFKKDAETLIAEAERAEAAKNYLEAAQKMGQAAGVRKNDPSLRVRQGDLTLQLAREDTDAIRRAIGAYRAALQMDPHHLPALERLVRYQRHLAQVSPQPQVFADLKETARRIVNLQPDNYEMQGLIHQATIEPWASNGYPASNSTIDEAVEALTELMA